MSDETRQPTDVDDIKGTLVNGKVYITEISTSHSEKIQKVRYEDNSWFTSTRVVFPGGIDLSDVTQLNKLTTAAITANSLCLSNNRKCMVRDGFKPNVAGFVHTAAAQGQTSKLIDPANVIDPDQLTAFIQGNLQKLSKLLCDLGVTAQLEEKGNQTPPAKEPAKPVEESAPAAPPEPIPQPEPEPVSRPEPVDPLPVPDSPPEPVEPEKPKRTNPKRRAQVKPVTESIPVQNDEAPDEVVK